VLSASAKGAARDRNTRNYSFSWNLLIKFVPGISPLEVMGLTVIAAAVLALLSWHLIEKPGPCLKASRQKACRPDTNRGCLACEASSPPFRALARSGSPMPPRRHRPAVVKVGSFDRHRTFRSCETLGWPRLYRTIARFWLLLGCFLTIPYFRRLRGQGSGNSFVQKLFNRKSQSFRRKIPCGR
jgi:hypothetical protein